MRHRQYLQGLTSFRAILLKKKFAYVKSVSESLKTKRQQNDMKKHISPMTIGLITMMVSFFGVLTSIVTRDCILASFMMGIFILSALIVITDNK